MRGLEVRGPFATALGIYLGTLSRTMAQFALLLILTFFVYSLSLFRKSIAVTK